MSSGQEKNGGFNNAVQQASLLNLVMTQSSFEVTHELHEHKVAAPKFITQTVLGSPVLDDDAVLMGSVRCRVWMNKADDVAEPKPEGDDAFDRGIFKIEALYGVLFKLPGEFDEQTLDTFFNRMAPLATWPYFRTHVAHIAAEAGLDIPILPIKKLLYPVKSAGGYVDPLEQLGSNES